MERALRLFAAIAISACAALYADNARADWNVIDCTHCPEWQMRDSAMYAGDGPHAVLDAANGVVKYYQVNGWNESQIEFGREVEVVEWAPPPGTDHYAQLMRQYYQIYGAPLTMSAEINISDVRKNYPGIWNTKVTAYDVVSDINLRVGIADRIENSVPIGAGFSAAMSEFLEMVRNLVGGNAAVNISITVVMDDGGKVQFRKDSPSSSWHYVKGSARFSNGQVVPEVGAREKYEYAATYVFKDASSVDDFWAGMSDIGAHLENVGGGSDQTIIVCSWRSTDSTLFCSRQL